MDLNATLIQVAIRNKAQVGEFDQHSRLEVGRESGGGDEREQRYRQGFHPKFLLWAHAAESSSASPPAAGCRRGPPCAAPRSLRGAESCAATRARRAAPAPAARRAARGS